MAANFRIRYLLPLLVLGSLFAGPAPRAVGEAFTSYAGCSPDGVRHSEPTHVCQQGDQIWAVLRYSDAPIEYRVCLTFARTSTSCGEVLEATPGRSSVTYIPTRGFAGLITVSWRVGSRELRSVDMRFVKDPIVPPFGVSPLIVAGTHRLFGLIVRHISPGLRIRAWRQCSRTCPLRLRLVSTKGETRRYRITGDRQNATFSFGDVLLVQVDAPGRQGSGTPLWGRLYQGRLVRDRSGGPTDTAVDRFGPNLCVAPGKTFRRAIECSKVRVVKPPT